MEELIPLDHPGLILKEEYIEDSGLSNYRVSKDTGITQTILGDITKGKRSISVKNAIRLSRFFGMSDDFWVNLQSDYDMRMTRRNFADELDKVRPFRAA